MIKRGKWHREIAGILLLILLPVLAGCFRGAETEGTGTGQGGTAAETGGELTDAPDMGVEQISVRQMSEMQMVYPAGAEKMILDEIDVLVSQMQRTYGVRLTPVPDTAEVCGEGEILIGRTNRTEVSDYIDSFRYYEYGVAIRGNNLVIAGGSPETLCLGLIYMRENIVAARKGGPNVFFRQSFNYEQRNSLYLDSLTLNGRPIGDYTVVYPAGEEQMKMLAERVAYWVRDKVNCELRVVSDAEAGSLCEIRIGNAAGGSGAAFSVSPQPWEGVITCSDQIVTLTGADAAGVAQAVSSFVRDIDRLCEEQQNTGGPHVGELTYLSEQLASPDETISTMSFNILYIYVEERRERVLQTIFDCMPDVFGVQEGTEQWVSLLQSGLSGLYSMSGQGDEREEHPELCPPGAVEDAYNDVFYNQAKYELVEEGHSWLSDTPDVCSKFSNSNFPRMVNWAVLRRKTDGKIICFANTHLDEAGDRDKQASVLVSLVNAVSERYGNCPTFITGDFNQERTQDGYLNTVAGGYTDSGKAAAVQVNPDKTLFTPFFGEYSPTASHKNNAITVDYCFVKNVPDADILYYRVFIDRVYGNFPSDHYPVYFRYRLA